MVKSAPCRAERECDRYSSDESGNCCCCTAVPTYHATAHRHPLSVACDSRCRLLLNTPLLLLYIYRIMVIVRFLLTDRAECCCRLLAFFTCCTAQCHSPWCVIFADRTDCCYFLFSATAVPAATFLPTDALPGGHEDGRSSHEEQGGAKR